MSDAPKPPPLGRIEWPTADEPVVALHADCLRVLARLPDDSVDACLTDPPYGIGFSSMQRKEKKDGFDRIYNDERPFVWFLWDLHRVMREGGALVCFCRWDVQEAFRQAIEWAGFQLISQLVWDRQVHGMGDLKGGPGNCHDVMWLASKGKFKLPYKRPTTVYSHQRVPGHLMVHPTEKPLSLMRELVRDYTEIGDLLFEPFGGSGATGIASAEEGRLCLMTELNETFVKEQRKRIVRLMGSERGEIPQLVSRRSPPPEEKLF